MCFTRFFHLMLVHHWGITEKETVGSSALDILAVQGPERPNPAWEVALL